MTRGKKEAEKGEKEATQYEMATGNQRMVQPPAEHRKDGRVKGASFRMKGECVRERNKETEKSTVNWA